MHLNVQEFSPATTYRYITNLVAPRPLALVSTISKEGKASLSAFSLFNVFSFDPPIVIFAPIPVLGDSTMKRTLHNVLEVPEVVIHMVTKEIVGQTMLAAACDPQGVEVFAKAGFTKESAVLVKPPMVMEAKAKLECHVIEVKPLGRKAGAGTLIICEVLYLHCCDTLYEEQGYVDPHKLDLVAAGAGEDYSEVNASHLLTWPQFNRRVVGMDGLPDFIKFSPHLSGNDLAALAGTSVCPAVNPLFGDERMEGIHALLKGARKTEALHQYAKELIHEQKIDQAWQVLLHSQPANQTLTLEG